MSDEPRACWIRGPDGGPVAGHVLGWQRGPDSGWQAIVVAVVDAAVVTPR